MHLSISQSKRFKEDCTRYQAAIDNASDPKLKAEMADLLRRLMLEVRNVDNMHNDSDIFINKKAPSNADNNRMVLVNIRKELEKRVASLIS